MTYCNNNPTPTQDQIASVHPLRDMLWHLSSNAHLTIERGQNGLILKNMQHFGKMKEIKDKLKTLTDLDQLVIQFLK